MNKRPQPRLRERVHGGERTCSVFVAAPNTTCALPAAVHIFWRAGKNSYACAHHMSDALAYEHYHYHELGDNCGMPGSVLLHPEKVCGYRNGPSVLEDSRRNPGYVRGNG